MSLYLDSSAIVKLVVPEAQSRALRERIRGTGSAYSSILARVEVLRATAGLDADVEQVARRTLDRIRLLRLDADLADRAGSLRTTPFLRSLDAIHVATAQQLAADLTALITYDQQMIDAARALGVPVESPT